MDLRAVSAISAMVAPVVLITASSIFANGLHAMYVNLYNHLRTLTHERLDVLADDQGALRSPADLSDIGRERLHQLDRQLPHMLHRLRVLRDAALAIYVSVGFQVLAVIAIGIAVVQDSESWGAVALGLVLAGTVVLLAGLVLSGRFIAKSSDAITYAVQRTQRLPLARMARRLAPDALQGVQAAPD